MTLVQVTEGGSPGAATFRNGPATRETPLADHLHVVAWLWRNWSLAVGTWRRATAIAGEPMRALHRYLQVREAERDR